MGAICTKLEEFSRTWGSQRLPWTYSDTREKRVGMDDQRIPQICHSFWKLSVRRIIWGNVSSDDLMAEK